ncbi:hypothetical protein HMPREF1162_2198 [ [[Propionibacterium] namnetense SK182B-JCVI]|uniref:Uncharacterized protein n=1 Tax=[Propionibacterium] namnetense SK182B-JCVI TaxID=1051006 RepID=F9NV42_9ACTN|nr:hypothetical protein HMPREF1162_2198 [ [[Propionibacterium] namnetense SK182B-JCVI]
MKTDVLPPLGEPTRSSLGEPFAGAAVGTAWQDVAVGVGIRKPRIDANRVA